MAIKKQVYIEAELDWAEQKLREWKEYVDVNPFANLVDRMDYKETARGGIMKTVIANKETQIKSLRDTMKEYLELLKVVNAMREAEEAKKKTVKGGDDVPERMRQ